MEYICDRDLSFILNKYHDASITDTHNRFIRNDGIFDESTGMDGEEIKKKILEAYDPELPHPIAKARAFEFVLKNTRISCDSRDIFPAICSIDRPINATVVNIWRGNIFGDMIPEIAKRQSFYENAGVATMWPDYDHSVPFWERVFGLGFSGVAAESEKARASTSLTEEQSAFYEGIKITYEAIIDLIGRLEALALATKGSERMAKALGRIKNGPPMTFYEALLVDYLYFMLSEHVEGLQVRSLCNFDRILYPYYKNDLARGVGEEELRRDLAYFLLQFTSISNYWNQPVFLGGCKEDESTEINELSYAFLDVYDRMNIYNPKVQLKIADSTPKEFILKALDMIRRGNNSIVFVSDATIRSALTKSGVAFDEARLCNVKGCYEYSPRGKMGTGMNYVNLMKPLEHALHKGCDGVTGEFFGLNAPELSEYDSFEALFKEYKRQLSHVCRYVMDTVNAYEGYLAYINPQSMLSATYPDCIKSGKDALSMGNSCVMFGFIADVSDSLSMIKKYVYDKKKITLQGLVAVLDSNYEGNEILRRRLLNDRDKYGNNKPLPDGIAKEIVDFVVSECMGKPNSARRGGKWCVGFHVARMSYIQGEKTAASANGRLKGEELSKNVSASMGQCREGATAAILSATKLDATSFTSDACLDLGLLPSAVKGEDGLEAMYGLLTTFIKRGGHAMHINVFDADTLRDAQVHPEKYRDLQIRVCGWNVLWNNISKKEQDGFIRQAEGLI